jgi:hypothetical protein
MIESVIAQAVPNSECFDVPGMRFGDKLNVLRALDTSITDSAIWQLMHKLNKLRAAAAHKGYQSLREERCAKCALRIRIDRATSSSFLMVDIVV